MKFRLQAVRTLSIALLGLGASSVFSQALEPVTFTTYYGYIASIQPRGNYTFLLLATTNAGAPVAAPVTGCINNNYLIIPKALPNHNTLVNTATLAHMLNREVTFFWPVSPASGQGWSNGCYSEYGTQSFKGIFGLNADLR
jgi:hypothetical protein